MVNLMKVMTQPYMVAGRLGKACVCGAVDLVQDIACGNGTKNPFNHNSQDVRDDSDGNPLNMFNGGNGKHTKYEDYKWGQLPRAAKQAVETLGMNQQIWNQKQWVPVDDKSWSGMTPREQQAAMTLGWDQAAWDHKYEQTNWVDLPNHVQNACKRLGFTQQMWDNGTWPAVRKKYWDNMTEAEHKALYTLGYTKSSWD